MAIIYSYQENEELRNSDMLVGTASTLHNGQVRKVTKNFTLGQLKTFISTGGLTLSNGGTSGPATLIDNVLNIPVYQGQITLTTTGSSGAATLIGNILNIPQYDGIGNIPTLNQVLTAGNTSLLNANVGELGLWDSANSNYITIGTTDQGITFNVPSVGEIFLAQNDVVSFGVGALASIKNNLLTAPRVFQLPNVSGTIALTSDIPSLTPAALTRTNDTNVTLTLGGTPNTALLQGVSLTLGWTGTLADSRIASAATWNAKQNTITLTTTGSGAATFIGSTLNIPTPPTATFTSLTTTGSSGSSTLTAGVLNVPTYTLTGLDGVPTSRTLTINGTAYDLTADRSWSVGTVTSVGLSMPSAFTVSSSPVTGSGTIAVTAAGVASQYVRGDGTLANFPTSTGGGASVSYYLNGSVSQGTIGGVAYKEMNSVPVIGTGTDFSINADGYIAQFITDAGDPNKLLIPGGNWNFETYFSASSGGGSPQFYIELYKYNGTTFTLIASNSTSPELITGGTNIDLYFSALAVPPTTLTVTDRLAVRFYVIHSGRTITMHTENSHLSQVITTFSSGLTALNGLTSQVQYFAVGTSGADFNISSAIDTHTFNLPTASATNRGALSSADWTAFNGKFTLPSLTSGSIIFSNGTTLAQDNANFFWDDTNNRLGLGTATPSWPLSFGNTFGNKIALYDQGSGTGIGFGVQSNLLQVFSTGDISFGSGYSTAFTKLVTIKSSGDMGIGTATPTTKLDVNGVITATGGNSTSWNAKQNAITLTTTGTGAATFISNTLNIPTPPTATFTSLTTTGSSGSSTLIAGVLNVPTYTLSGLGGQPQLSGTGFVKASGTTISYDNTTYYPYPAGTTSQYVRGDGSLATLPTGGITGSGTTNYIPKFTSSSAIGNSLIYDNGTNVGIGQTTPTAKLDVNGDALINEVIVGRGAGNDASNTVIGKDAFFNNLSGQQNTVIGYSAGANLTSGGSNVFIGQNAGGNVNSGVGNTIIGTLNSLPPTGTPTDFSDTLSISKGESNYGVFLPHIWAPAVISTSSTATIISAAAGSYRAMFIEYVIEDESGNIRGGYIKGIWNNDLSVIKITEDTTSSIGVTSNYVFDIVNDGSSNAALQITSLSADNVYCSVTSRLLTRPY